VVEALAKQQAKHAFAYGKVDPVEAGRKGGSQPKGSKMLRTAIRNVLESNDGQSNAWLARLELERERARGRELYRKDKELAEMDELLLSVREQVELAIAERNQLDAEREAQLEQALVDDDALGTLLRNVGTERLERVLPLVGLQWYDEDGDHGVAS
jgi:hypothetical protein